jgi:hypothetical protein
MLLRLSLLLMCLVFGLSINIGLAMWAAFATPKPPLSLLTSNPASLPTWPGSVPADWPTDLVVAIEWAAAGPDVPCQSKWVRTSGRHGWRTCEEMQLHNHANSSICYVYRVQSFGFPFRSLRRDTILTVDLNPAAWPSFSAERPVEGLLGGIRHRSSTRAALLPSETIPVVPLISGFIGNTLVYAIQPAIVMLLTAKIGRKAKAGECLRCRYPIVGLAVCPECGLENPNPLVASAVQSS